jgi:hypothetical protein
VIALPPLDNAAVNDNDAEAFPRVADPIVGGAGVVGRTVMTIDVLPEQHSRDWPSLDVRRICLSPGLVHE